MPFDPNRLAAEKAKFSQEFNPNKLRDAVAKQGGATDPYGRHIPREEIIREMRPSEKYRAATEAPISMATGFIKNPVTGILGGGAFRGANETIAQGVAALAGEPGQSKTPMEALKRSGRAALEGAGLESVGRILGYGTGKLFASNLTPIQKDLVNIAEEKGVPLTIADVTKSKGWSRFETMLDNIPLSGSAISKFTVKKLEAFKKYLGDTITQSGTNLDRQQVGELVQDVLNKRSQISREGVDAAYATARELVDSRALTPAKELKDMAQKILDSETKVGASLQNKGLISTAKEILAKRAWNFEDLDAYRMPISENIDKNMLSTVPGYAGKATPTSRNWTMLKSGLDKSIDTFFSNQPVEAQGAMEIAKATAKKNITTFKNREILKLVNTAPEKIVDMVIKKNNVTGINLVRKATGDEGFSSIKQRFMTDMLETSNLGADNVATRFQPSKIATELGKYEDSTLNAVFSKQELSELNKISVLADSLKTAEQAAGNKSNTATVLMSAGGLVGGGYGVAKNIKDHPVYTTLAILSAPALAKVYLSKTGRNLILKGLEFSPVSEGAAKMATRLGSFIALNKLTKDNDQK